MQEQRQNVNKEKIVLPESTNNNSEQKHGQNIEQQHGNNH
jgi:hypothetical protein